MSLISRPAGSFSRPCTRWQRKRRERGEKLSGFILIDEDFFLHEKRAREFLECVRAAKGPTPPLMGFGSVRGLSKFTADEIAEMGFDAIWTAFEGTESGYGKLQGRPLGELYTSLKSRGISLLSSMIIGFPYQDQAQVEKEFGHLMALEPSMTQVLIYFAFPGTPFHAQVVKEGRYLPEYVRNPDLRRWDGFSMHFRHPHFSPPEMETLQKDLFRADFERLGPSLVRIVQVWLEGYKNLRNSPASPASGTGRAASAARSSQPIRPWCPRSSWGPRPRHGPGPGRFVERSRRRSGRFLSRPGSRAFCRPCWRSGPGWS